VAQTCAVLLASLLPNRRRTHYILGVGYGTAMAASSTLPPASSYDCAINHAPAAPILPAVEYFAARGITYPLPRTDQPPLRLRRFCVTA